MVHATCFQLQFPIHTLWLSCAASHTSGEGRRPPHTGLPLKHCEGFSPELPVLVACTGANWRLVPVGLKLWSSESPKWGTPSSRMRQISVLRASLTSFSKVSKIRENPKPPSLSKEGHDCAKKKRTCSKKKTEAEASLLPQDGFTTSPLST